jgi:hypothetical protein
MSEGVLESLNRQEKLQTENPWKDVWEKLVLLKTKLRDFYGVNSIQDVPKAVFDRYMVLFNEFTNSSDSGNAAALSEIIQKMEVFMAEQQAQHDAAESV